MDSRYSGYQPKDDDGNREADRKAPYGCEHAPDEVLTEPGISTVNLVPALDLTDDPSLREVVGPPNSHSLNSINDLLPVIR